uniref:Uncharacterized protein n=1 Tax=Coprothermobacter proteolyticus (strain ATCC 35245 / DSM 5265 / OCM 4 / BT) TaxID=309798 RepID=B5Y6V9_COPPD
MKLETAPPATFAKGRQTLAEVKLNGLCWEATQG